VIRGIQIKNFTYPIIVYSQNDPGAAWNGSHHLTFQNLYIYRVDILGGYNHGHAIDIRQWDGNWTAPHDISILNCTLDTGSEAAILIEGGVHDVTIDNVSISNIYDRDQDSSGDGITFNQRMFNPAPSRVGSAPYNIAISNVSVSHICRARPQCRRHRQAPALGDAPLRRPARSRG
jgi:hypothetical protein